MPQATEDGSIARLRDALPWMPHASAGKAKGDIPEVLLRCEVWTRLLESRSNSWLELALGGLELALGKQRCQGCDVPLAQEVWRDQPSLEPRLGPRPGPILPKAYLGACSRTCIA